MLLSNGLIYWAGYFRSLLPGLLPLLLLALLLVFFFHQRKKRKQRQVSGVLKLHPAASGSSYAFPPGSDEDRKRLWKRSRLDLLLAKAKGMALKKDLQSVLRQSPEENLSNPEHMENLTEKIAAYEAQVLALQNKIDMLETAPAPAAGEAHYLRELITDRDREIDLLRSRLQLLEAAKSTTADPADGSPEEITASSAVNVLQEKINQLQQEVNEQAYLAELVEEQKLQIQFLNGQLEQRIRSGKQLEQQLEHGSLVHHQLADEMILAKNKIKELTEQQALLEAEAGDQKDQLALLRQELEYQQDKSRQHQEKLGYYQGLLQRMHREIEQAVTARKEEVFAETN